TYRDAGISGGKGRDQRPGFDQMLKDATRRRFDLLMAWSVDRLGRSLQHLVGTLADLQAAGIDLYLRQQAIDTTSPSGRALFQMLGVFAEFERYNGQQIAVASAPDWCARIAARGFAACRGTGCTGSGRAPSTTHPGCDRNDTSGPAAN